MQMDNGQEIMAIFFNTENIKTPLKIIVIHPQLGWISCLTYLMKNGICYVKYRQ